MNYTHPIMSHRYDPGQPGAIRPAGGTRFAVESFKDPGVWYIVDRAARSCTCPDFTYRRIEGYACKHMKAVEDRLPALAAEAAKKMSVESLRRALGRRDVPRDLRAILALELFERSST